MFSLFPIHRPRLGISFRAQALDLVEVRRRWGNVPTVTRLASRSLPTGLLVTSATSPNMVDPVTLAKELEALLDGVRDRAVAIDLPMACGTAALCHFETFPTVRAEQEALLRWRLRQDEHLTALDLTLRWHSYPAVESTSTGITIMVMAIRQSILDQYHQVCEEANLIPVSMGFSTFHVLHLARSAVPSEDEVYVAHRTAEALIVLALRQGRPVRLRVKPTRRTSAGVKAELLQTLRYFAQDDPPRDHGAARTTPLYLVEERVSVEESPSPKDTPEVWTLSDQPSWTVPILRAQWETAPIVSAVAHPDQPPFGALACVRHHEGIMTVPTLTRRPPARSGIPLVPLSVEPSMIRVMRAIQWGLSSILICAGLLTGWMWSEKRTLDEEAARYVMAAERTETFNQQFKAQLDRDQLSLSASQMTAIQQEVRFINQLAEKRGFSWTQLLADLEEALPTGISIGTIHRDEKTATITIDGHATGMDTLKALMTTLQTRPGFRQPVLHQHQLSDSSHSDEGERATQGVEFSVTVQYRGIVEKAGKHEMS